MKRRLCSILLMGCMALGMCACGNKTTETSDPATVAEEGSETKVKEQVAEAGDGELTPITLATATWVGAGPFYIAKEKGFFEEKGLDVTMKTVDDEAAYGSLIGSNSVDAVGQVMDRLVINKATGIDETIVMAFDQSTGGDGIVAAEDINSIEDLKGKTVALDKSSTSYFYFLTVLTQAGMKEEDVEIKDMNADAAGTSFVQGQVDAAVTWEPWLSNAGEREGGHLLCDSSDYPNTIVDTVAFSDAFIEKNPEAVSAFIQAWDEAVAWYYDGNEEEGNQIMADGLSIDLEDFTSQVVGVTWYDKDQNAAFFDETADDNIYKVSETAINFWAERQMINKAYDSKEVISGEFLER